MLVLTRKSEQSVIIGRNIEVKILSVHGDQVSLGFSAPSDISIYRKEVYEAIQSQNQQAVQHGDISIQDLTNAFTSHFTAGGEINSQKKGVMPKNNNSVP